MSWIPLESNPEVMNKLLEKFGVPKTWEIVDVYSLDPEMLAFIPNPTLALILLFPSTKEYKERRAKQDEILKAKGQTVSDNLYYSKQYAYNACGTVAILHCIANNLDRLELQDGFLKDFIQSTAGKTPEEKGKAFQNNEELAQIHNSLAAEGQTEVPPDRKTFHHFVAFVHKDGQLYELDGSKSFPVNHGPTCPDTFIQDAAQVIRGIMKNDSNDLSFTVCALATRFD